MKEKNQMFQVGDIVEAKPDTNEFSHIWVGIIDQCKKKKDTFYYHVEWDEKTIKKMPPFYVRDIMERFENFDNEWINEDVILKLADTNASHNPIESSIFKKGDHVKLKYNFIENLTLLDFYQWAGKIQEITYTYRGHICSVKWDTKYTKSLSANDIQIFRRQNLDYHNLELHEIAWRHIP